MKQVLVLLVVAGCHSEIDDYRQFTAELGRILCERPAACPRSPEVVEKCSAQKLDFFTFFQREEDLKAERAHFVAAAAQRCLAAVRASPRCDPAEIVRATVICDAAVVGKHGCDEYPVIASPPPWVQEGGFCEAAIFFDPCADGLFCNAQDQCERVRPVGADCTTGRCADGLRCPDGVCVPTVLLGGACDPPADACESGTRCAAGKCSLLGWAVGDPCDCLDQTLYCSSKSQTCQKRIEDGHDCDPQELGQCLDSVCDPRFNACQRIPPPKCGN